MMINSYLIVFSAFFNLCIGTKQDADLDQIVWSEGRKLEWSDYRFVPSDEEGFDNAESSLYVSIKPKLGKDNLPNYEVHAFFNKKLSWTSDTTSQYLLSHERFHFDIAELFARKIRKGIMQLRGAGVRRVNAYNDLIKKELTSYTEFQELYDEETNRSLNVVKQEEWEERVKKELDELSEYALDMDL